ncbi:MAG: type I-C CRISPR-associated protein Cas8c/Csd1 [Oscillospiraceae bacterium]|nr:type I-C CRISPR-associated protein Cas8c/Csd1 [Oscillospiraceae bacterium]
MSWNEELFRVYEYNCNRDFDPNEPLMLPVAHSTANAQIEITIDLDGMFQGARRVEKSEAVTVIPATEDSAVRTSGICPMPFDDKLVYIAGDYKEYFTGKNADNESYYTAYMNQLRRWKESEHNHRFVDALYRYIDQKCLMSDLIKSGVLVVDENGKLKDKEKIAGINQEDSFVRVIINTEKNSVRTWEDKSFRDSFISFNSDLMGEKQLCYATGEFVASSYKHPSKIRHSGDKAKLISTNDESGFTYRGRFANKEESISVGYEYSQKVHNALRWLISKQGNTYDTMTVIVWASALQNIPDPMTKAIEDDDPFLDDEDQFPDTMPMYMSLLNKRIFSNSKKLEPKTKVMIMGLDAATTGRLNISMYSELDGSCFLSNIEQWHTETAWLRFNGKKKMNYINSFNPYEIIKNAFGTEQGNFIDCDKKIISGNILRLLKCITEGARIPSDIVNALYQKASNPLAYEQAYNHRSVLETACGMIRKQRLDNRKEDISMAYDPNITDRSYLYGCLLAIADKAESEAYDESERNVRVTNARRYWNAFSQRPFLTWGIIENKLRPYLEKLGKGQVKYSKWMNEMCSKMTSEMFSDNSRLSPMYLLGYHQFTDYMFSQAKEAKSANKEEK